ncbi:MAG: hypothetical protein ACMUHY_00520 [Thermoplasmatota archaeon]
MGSGSSEPSLSGHFVENRGQWPDKIRFVASTDFGRVAITGDGLIYDIRRTSFSERMADQRSEEPYGQGIDPGGRIITASFENGDSSDVMGGCPVEQRNNYFIGGEASDWITDVPCYAEVLLEDIYYGTDARFYFRDRSFKYDLVLAPDACPEDIRLKIDGIEEVEVKDRSVDMRAGGAVILRDSDLFVYGSDSGREIAASFRSLGGTIYGFDVAVREPGESIVIDPVIRSAFISGEGTDEGRKVIVGPDGSHYLGGVTHSLDFPVTPGSYQLEMNTTPGYSGPDMFLTKMTGDLDGIVFSTFIGGIDYDWFTDMELYDDGSVVIAGYTNSANFPNTTGALDNSMDGFQDGFVTRISPSGDELIFSTFFGGDSNDWIEGISLDDAGRIYLAGWSFSSDLPQTGAVKNLSSDRNLIFTSVLKSDGSSLARSMVLNSSVGQRCYDILTLENGNVLISGYTYNRSFPVTPGCIDTGPQGRENSDADLFLTEIDIWGHSIERSGKIGGSIFERPDEIEIDDNGDIWIVGVTTSPDLPLTDDAFQDPVETGSMDWFVIRVDRNITTLGYSTYISGNKDEWNINIEVGTDGIVYLSGKTWSTNITMTDDAFDDTFDGTTDIVVMAFRRENMSLVHSTYLGGQTGEYANSMQYLYEGTIAIAGYTLGDFPVGIDHYLNHSSFRPGFVIYYQLPVPPGPPENLTYEIEVIDDRFWINLSWDPPFMQGNGFPVEYQVVLIWREGIQERLADFDELTDTFIVFSRRHAPYEERCIVTARTTSGMSESGSVVLEEDEPPRFVADYTPDNITRDSYVMFNVDIRDNWKLDERWVEYWYDNGTRFNASLGPWVGNTYNHTIYTRLAWGPVHYSFHATDIFGNRNETENSTVDVIDDQPPLLLDLTPEEVEYGQNITFRVGIDENAGLESVVLTIVHPLNNETFNMTLETGNNWTYVYNPGPSDIAVQYIITARDVFGLASDVEGITTIIDRSPPILVEDLSDASIEYNSAFLIRAVFWDMSPMDTIKVRYLIGTDTVWQEAVMSGTYNFSHTVELPWKEKAPNLWYTEITITYYFEARDSWGNFLRTANVQRNISDSVEIGPLTFWHLPYGYTGDEFLFLVQVENGTDVEGLDIALWYHEGSRERYPMDLFNETPGVFYISTTLRGDSLDPLFYEIILRNNAFGEAVYGPYNITVFDGTPPTLPAIMDRTIRLGDPITIIVNAYDNIGIVQYLWEGTPVEASGNSFSWIANRIGIFEIRVFVYDGAGNSNTRSFTLTVEDDGSGGDGPVTTEKVEGDNTGVICILVLIIVVVIITTIYYANKQKKTMKGVDPSSKTTLAGSTPSEEKPGVAPGVGASVTEEPISIPLEDEGEGPLRWEDGIISEHEELTGMEDGEETAIEDDFEPPPRPGGPRLAPLPPPLDEE